MTTAPVHEELVRPLTGTEAIMETFNKMGVMISGYQFTLKSKKPLQVHHVDVTLKHLFRKIPNLQLCIKGEGMNLAFYKIGEESISLKCHEKDVDPSALLQKNVRTPFDSKVGPLWKCDLILQQDEKAADSEGYSNTVIFTIHHAITDGFSNFKMWGIFVKLLNDVIGGKAIDDKPVVRMVDGDLLEKLMKNRRKVLEDNPQLLDEFEERLFRKGSEESYFHKMSQPPQENRTTKHITRDLSEDKMRSLLNIFKNERVSFHSGFCSIVELAQVSLIKEMCQVDPDKKFIEVNSAHAVNGRRYADEKNKNDVGTLIGFFSMNCKTPLDMGLDNLQKLWDFARDYHNELHAGIQEGKAFDFALLMMLRPPKKNFFDGADNVIKSYYHTTNMGDVTDLLGGSMEHVEVSWMTRTTPNHGGDVATAHVLQTLRGRLLYGLDYVSYFVSDDLAKMIVDKIFDLIDLLIEKYTKSGV